MNLQKMRISVLMLLIMVLWITQNVGASEGRPFNSLFQPESQASVFQPPLGHQNGVIFAPRKTYDNNNVLIEDTDYGAKNPDLKNLNPSNSTCFGADWRTLYHAGEDLYNSENPSATVAGEIVTAIANGTVTEVSNLLDINYPGRAVTIYHDLPGQDVWSVYIHLNTVDVAIGDPVSLGQPIGTVLHQDYTGWFPEYHSTDDSHLHFEIRYFPDARGIYTGYPACERGDVAGRGYTPPDIHPDNYPSPGAGYTDPTDFINSHSSIPTPTPTLHPSQNVGVLISQGSDDGGTNPGDCVFSNTDNEVYLGACFNGGDITSGFRFQNVQIPRNANIESAYVRFTVDGEYTTPIHVQIDAEASGNPLTYSASSPPSNRLTTGNLIAWNITESWSLGEMRDTPDLSGLIHSIVVRPDWNSGQPISIIIQNAGSNVHRRVIGFERVSFDSGLSTAQLVITYNTNPTPTPTATPLNYTPQPAFTPTSIPPTFTHIAPTPVPTNPPAPCWCCIFCDCPNLKASASNGIYGTLTPPANVTSKLAEAVDLATLLYRVRDEIMNQTPEGQRLVSLYYTYAPKIAELTYADPNLYDQGLGVIELFVPNLQALVDGQGNTVTITAGQVAEVRAFLDELLTRGDAELQGVIQSEMDRRPLESMIGMTMDEAWNYTNGYQFEWLQPVSNGSPYQSQIGRTIPIQFTLADMEGNFVTDPSVTIELADADGNVVVGPIGLGNNPATGIVIQGGKYHYNLQTKGLSAGLYTLRVYYNAVNPGQPYIWTINLAAGKK